MRRVGGAACLVLGTAMLVTPGPGVLVILVGLKMLGVLDAAPEVTQVTEREPAAA